MDKSEYRKKEWMLKTIPEEEFGNQVVKFMIKQLIRKNYIISKQNKIFIRIIPAFAFYLFLTLIMAVLFDIEYTNKTTLVYTTLIFSVIFIVFLIAEVSNQIKMSEQIKKQLREEELMIEEIKRRIKAQEENSTKGVNQ